MEDQITNQIIKRKTAIRYRIQKIILFDGVCNFCNSSVDFIIKRDPQSALQIRFFTIRSRAGISEKIKYQHK